MSSSKSKTCSYTVLALAFALLFLWVRPQYGGDSADYALKAYPYLTRPSLASPRALWAFGHLLWRPAAAAFAGGKTTPAWTHLDPSLTPLPASMALNATFSLAALLLFYRMGGGHS